MSDVPPASSLIFVVILAVWAVYLVQHWVRRRDHLATARSVDRFSESMRVLERRRALPKPDLTQPTPRSYSVSPLRPARPQVVIKRGPAPATATTADSLPHIPAGATAVAPSPAFRRARVTAQLRAAGLLIGSLTMVTLVGLSLAKLAAPWAALVGILVLAVAVGTVRWSASRELTRRRQNSRQSSRRTAPQISARSPRQHSDLAPTAAAHAAGVDHPAHAFARQSVAATTRTARRAVIAAELYDVEQVESSLTEVVVPAEPQVVPPPGAHAEELVSLGDDDLPMAGTWSPVPVPPPTYTLKAKAYRTELTGGAQLPSDGIEMALAEEFEELPAVDRVG